MKTLKDFLETFEPEALDGRDAGRLAMFMTTEQLIEKFGSENLNPEVLNPDNQRTVIEWTRENILAQLKDDVEFAFNKALGQRGISSSCMFAVVKMWCNALEEGLENFSDSDYSYYGLPLFKAVAVKYGFNNPIGDDNGDEEEYNN